MFDEKTKTILKPKIINVVKSKCRGGVGKVMVKNRIGNIEDFKTIPFGPDTKVQILTISREIALIE